MPRPMTKYKTVENKKPEHSFIDVGNGKMAYAQYGHLKTYSNIKQADIMIAKLTKQGFDVTRTATWPFLIIPTEVS